MAVLTNGQLELASGSVDELVIGDGTDFRLPEGFIQWWLAPRVRTSDYAYGGAHGVHPGLDLLDPHVTTMQVMILAATESDLADRIDEWKAACRVIAGDVVAVRAMLLGRTRLRYGRFRIPGEVEVDTWSIVPTSYALDAGCEPGLRAKGSAQFVTLDARTYGDSEYSAITSRGEEGSGFTFPFTFPIVFGVGTTGVATITNAGNRTGRWSARLEGPLTNPVILHYQTGRWLAFTANGGLELASGDYLDLDSSTRTALQQGVADRRDRLSVDSQWWELAVGTNDFQLAADLGSGTLTVTGRDAWLS